MAVPGICIRVTEVGYEGSRQLCRVECLACDTVIRESTTDPMQAGQQHVRERHPGGVADVRERAPLLRGAAPSPLPLEPIDDAGVTVTLGPDHGQVRMGPDPRGLVAKRRDQLRASREMAGLATQPGLVEPSPAWEAKVGGWWDEVNAIDERGWHPWSAVDAGGRAFFCRLAELATVDALDRRWQPIDTAPRNGTPILVYESGGEVASVQWRRWGSSDDTHAWLDSDGGEWLPTHWMPRPAPPVGGR